MNNSAYIKKGLNDLNAFLRWKMDIIKTYDGLVQ